MNTTGLLRESLYRYRLRWMYRYFRSLGRSVIEAFNSAKQTIT